jgi:uncharacterized membrane protein YdjX (TVP38/TMEM64 family)
MRRRTGFILLALAGLASWAIWSWQREGIIYLLATSGNGDQSLGLLRERLLAWGLFAPAIYVAAVVVEVLVVPIPGALLYAPGGALFGGLLGGTLSLAGNVIGAGIACWLGAQIGDRLLSRWVAREDLRRYHALLEGRSFWVILLLRLNPLTSSDLVSYGAGLAGTPIRIVMAATLIGMAPLCYLQAYLADEIFMRLPLWLSVVMAVAAVILLVSLLLYRRDSPTTDRSPDAPA